MERPKEIGHCCTLAEGEGKSTTTMFGEEAVAFQSFSMAAYVAAPKAAASSELTC